MSRRLHSTLDLRMPDMKTKIHQKQLNQKEQHHTSVGVSLPMMMYMSKNYSYGPKRIPAVTEGSTKPVSYTVQTGNGCSIRRHVDQNRKRQVVMISDTTTTSKRTTEPTSLPDLWRTPEAFPKDSVSTNPVSERVAAPAGVLEPPPATTPPVMRVELSPEVHHSVRTRKTPAHLKDFVR